MVPLSVLAVQGIAGVPLSRHHRWPQEAYEAVCCIRIYVFGEHYLWQAWHVPDATVGAQGLGALSVSGSQGVASVTFR